MDEDVAKRTAQVAELYFSGVAGEKPYELWRSFDRDLARDLSLFITGRMYAREVLPHGVRQLVTVAALTVLGRTEELELHLQAALNVGCEPRQLAEVIFQMGTYGGVPTVNTALKALRRVLQARGQWPLPDAD